MIIRDTPDDLDNFVMVDSELGFKLQQKGFKPMYMDFDALYFRKTNKLLKFLKKLKKEL